MKTLSVYSAWLAALALISIPADAIAQSPSDSNASPPEYKLVWADEFSKEPDGLPDPAKWSYEVGFIRNNESQYYTKARKENARIENGQLIIEARKEEYSSAGPSAAKPGFLAHYTSAALETIGKADWQYGRIEVRAKLPAGKGVWPAIWTLVSNFQQTNKPHGGEIDIMELVGKEPGIIYGTIHYFIDGKHHSSSNHLRIEKTDTDFHVYAAEWTPDLIDLFVDDKKYVSFDINTATDNGENPFRVHHYLILNVALGGSWGGPIDGSIFPQRMTVDYVRVYQKTVP